MNTHHLVNRTLYIVTLPFMLVFSNCSQQKNGNAESKVKEWVIGSDYNGGNIFYIENGNVLVIAPSDFSGVMQWDAANNACNSLSIKGYGGWRLPTKEELKHIYDNWKIKGLGGFASDIYWSSTKNDDLNVWAQGFNDGNQNLIIKYVAYHVRAVKSFSIK